ncbi:MAG: hypothetical protein QM784_19890 [Polyangiaceae bacterium]
MPVPVPDSMTTERPASTGPMAASWIGVGVRIPILLEPLPQRVGDDETVDVGKTRGLLGPRLPIASLADGGSRRVPCVTCLS